MDLTLTIKADGSEAKKELADVERGIKNVETASAKSGSTTSRVMQALAGETSKVAKAQDQLTGTTKALSGVTLQAANSTGLSGKALNDYYLNLVKADKAVIEAAASQKVMAETTTSTASATRLATLAMNPYVLAMAAATVGAVALGAVIVQSTRYYYEHSKATADSRKAMSELSDGWKQFQMTVGAAALGEDFSIAKPIHALNRALIRTGEILATTIEGARILAGVMATLGYTHAGSTMGFDIAGYFTKEDALRKGSGGSTVGQIIDPNATAAGRMQGNAQYLRDLAEEKKMLAELAETRFQEAKRIRETKDALEFLSFQQVGKAQMIGGGLTSGINPFLSATTIQSAYQMALMRPAFLPPSIATTLGLTGLNLPGDVSLDTVTGIPQAPQTKLGGLFGSSSGFGQLLAGSVLSAIQGGGNVAQSAGSAVGGLLGSNLAGMLTGGAGTAIGGLAGGALNAILPGAGMLLGPLLGKGIGAIGSLFNRNKGRDTVEGFADSMGGFDVLQSKLAELDKDGSGTGDRLWRALTQGTGRNNPTQAQANIDAVTRALQKHDDQLARAESAMEKYGFTWEELGKKVQQSRINDIGEDLRLDWEALISVGVDTDAIVNRMSGSVSEFVQKAVAAGTEIPTAMRPMIQQMLEAGKLIGANGEKLEDLEDITWAKSMTEGFQDVTKAIYELRDALVNGVGGAIDDINGREVHIRTNIDSTDIGARGDNSGEIEGVNSFARGTNGYQDFGRGRTVRLHGLEKVTPIGKDDSGVLLEEVRGLRSDMRTLLPREIRRSVRDGVQLRTS